MTKEIKKYQLYNDELSEATNYGIYNYFKYNDNKLRSKMLARVNDKNYVISVESLYEKNENKIHMFHQKKYENNDCDIVSYGNDLSIYAGTYLTTNQLDILISVFMELKDYYNESNKDKYIHFSGEAFKNQLNDYNKCSDIDDILVLLNEFKQMKNEIVKEEPKTYQYNMGYVKLWLLGLITVILSILILVSSLYLVR